MIVDNMVTMLWSLDGTLITDECEIEVTSMLVTDNGDEMCWWPKSSPTLSHQHHHVTNIIVTETAQAKTPTCFWKYPFGDILKFVSHYPIFNTLQVVRTRFLPYSGSHIRLNHFRMSFM